MKYPKLPPGIISAYDHANASTIYCCVSCGTQLRVSDLDVALGGVSLVECECQPRLPVAGAVRDLEIATPHALELPASTFALTPPRETTETQCSIFAGDRSDR